MASFRRKHLSGHGIFEAVALASITAIIGYLNGFLRIDMTEMLSVLFRECEGGGDYNGLCQWVLLFAVGLVVQSLLTVPIGHLHNGAWSTPFY